MSTAPYPAAAVLDAIRAQWDSSVRCGITEPHIRPIPVPHTVPSPAGKFKALFYWDTYFTNLGLLRTGRVDLARSNCEAFAWLVDQLGFVPNSAFVNDDRRSQPPLFTRMVAEVFAATGDRGWLATMLPRLEREQAWWRQHRAWPDGLNRNGDDYDDAYRLRFYNGFAVRRLKAPADLPDALKIDVARHLIAEAETGADFTPVFAHRCVHFVPVQLNLILWSAERDLAALGRACGQPETEAAAWEQRAADRASLIRAQLWDEHRGLFLNRDRVYGLPARIASLDTFYALYLGFATGAEAARIREALPLFEREHGVACTEDNPEAGRYQWSFPVAWPPLTWICAAGLARYGFADDARRIARKYCSVMEGFHARHGHLYEKYDARTGQLDQGEYHADPMLGWCAGVYVALQDLLT